jgi:hypothetical protein
MSESIYARCDPALRDCAVSFEQELEDSER